MAKHVHAENMALYAQDAMETPRPWERWEFKVSNDIWYSLECHPAWTESIQFRRKPKMLSVTLASGEVVSWPAPHCTELEYGDAYFYVDVDGSVMVEEWDCLEWDERTLADGWVHLTEDAAKQHAAALLKINTQGRDDG